MLNSNSTDAEIREYYDSNWGCTIQQLMRMTGKAKDEIKSILLNSESTTTVVIG